MALYGAQGPQLGLPQMISSRVQFGVYGAVIPIALVCLMYVGFSASGPVLAGQSVSQLLHVSDAAGIVAFTAVIVAFTVIGYRVIHGVGRIASVVGVIAFVYMFAQLLIGHDISALLANRHFTLSSFLLAMSLSASWRIAFGPYVADYSRYLSRTTSPRKTFWAIALGAVIGAQVSMVFGVFAAALAGKQFSGHEVSFVVGLGATGTIAALLYFAVAFGKITITTLNAYGSVMSIATVVSGFRCDQRLSARSRLAYILGMVGVAMWLALAGRHAFLKEFSSFILFLLAFFTPWSAINLVDYYFITRDRYDVPALYDPDGRCGRWNVTGIPVYAVGVLVQLPFISSAFYTGPLGDLLDGTDISWIVGLIVLAVLYFIAARGAAHEAPTHLILPAETARVAEFVSK